DEPTAAAEKTYRPGAPAAITLTPATDENTVGEQHCVTAQVRDEFGNPVEEGTVVRFAVAGANARVGSDGTDGFGSAEFCYTGTVSGADAITAYADTDNDGSRDAGEPIAAATKVYHPGNPAAVVLTPPTDQNRVGDEHCVTATVVDAFGNPTPGVTVRFAVAGANTAAGTDQTDAAGQAAFCYTGTRTGLDTITAYADTDSDGTNDETEPEGTATKLYQPGDPATVVITPPTDENVVGDQHCVMAQVADGFGNPTPGMTVRFTVAGANSRAGADQTDELGQAEFCYTGTTAGLDTITAYADTDGDGMNDATEPEGAATKLYQPGAPATVEVEPATDENVVGDEHCVVATVRDPFGNVVPDVLVEFTVTGANVAGGTDTTDAAGQARFCYTGTTSGVDTIRATADADGDGTAEAGEPTGVATKAYRPGEPASAVLEPPAATNTVGEEHCVTAVVRDEFGNLVGSGHQVVFTVTGANPQGPAVRTTDADGRATFCYTGTRTGEDVIEAYVDNDENRQFGPGDVLATPASKTYTPGAPFAVTITPAADTNTVGDEHCVTATVVDEFGNPTPGVTVRFAVAGANTASGTDQTDADGTAEFCYTGTRAGVDAISAYADSNNDGDRDVAEPQGAATKTYVPGTPARLTLSPKQAVNVVGDEHCVTATVTDAFGNPTSAVEVDFAVAGFNATSGERTTDGSGRAEFCYTGQLPGEDAIRAFADLDRDDVQDVGEPADLAAKTYVVPPSTPGCRVAITDGGWIIAANGDRASFGGNAKALSSSSVSGEQVYTDHGPVQPMQVKSVEMLALTCTANKREATLYGLAKVDQMLNTVPFRIRLRDSGQPRRGDMYGILVGNGYYSGEQPLQGGNVVIR
nr:Ig-like domain-containing protein [Nocardioidaceae bacterium]